MVPADDMTSSLALVVWARWPSPQAQLIDHLPVLEKVKLNISIVSGRAGADEKV